MGVQGWRGWGWGWGWAWFDRLMAGILRSGLGWMDGLMWMNRDVMR